MGNRSTEQPAFTAWPTLTKSTRTKLGQRSPVRTEQWSTCVITLNIYISLIKGYTAVSNEKFFNVRMHTVGLWAIQMIWNSETPFERKEAGVQVVVYQVELLIRRQSTSSAMECAREFRVGRIVFVFPHLSKNSKCCGISKKERITWGNTYHSELWKNIRDGPILSSFVHENNNTSSRIQHLF